MILLLSIASVIGGFLTGHYIPNFYGLIVMCICNSLIVSMLIFSFLIVFTGTWVVLCVVGILLLAICVYLPFKYKEMM